MRIYKGKIETRTFEQLKLEPKVGMLVLVDYWEYKKLGWISKIENGMFSIRHSLSNEHVIDLPVGQLQIIVINFYLNTNQASDIYEEEVLNLTLRAGERSKVLPILEIEWGSILKQDLLYEDVEFIITEENFAKFIKKKYYTKQIKNKLYLLSREPLQKGIRVIDHDGEIGTITEMKDLHNIQVEYNIYFEDSAPSERPEGYGFSLWCMDPTCTEEYIPDGILHLVGEVSKYAIWIKENQDYSLEEIDHLNEKTDPEKWSEERWGKPVVYGIACTPPKPFVKFICPNCKTSH